MKKSLLMLTVLMMVAGSAMAAVLVNETFSYADGSLVPNGGWANHSGTAGTLLVASGAAVVTHDSGSEDANIAFAASTGTIFFSFDFMVDALAGPVGGGDYEYFAHFMPATGFTYRTRVDIVEPTGSGDFSVGLSTSTSTAEVTWASDLNYDTWYHLVGSYNQDTDVSQLWIDPAGLNPPYITGLVGGGAAIMEKFALRQSSSTADEYINIDNLLIADACEDVFSECPTVSNEDLSWGAVKALY